MLARVLALAAFVAFPPTGAFVAAPANADEDITHGGVGVAHEGNGAFLITPAAGNPDTAAAAARIDLTQIRHGYDPAIDDDVPIYTNVTLNDRVPALIDGTGRAYALITLYQIDPPLADLPSRDPGVDRGIDMQSPADMVKSAYSNYVSPVVTDDAERRAVAGHPIGHFLVKVEIGGYPTLLTGMTTIRRADDELVELTLERQLGFGGVLLTPQPGRLNSAAEAMAEIGLRQRRLRVIDGLYYRKNGGRNLGPEYVIEDGNVVFARFKLPPENAKDALAAFVEFLWRGQHRIFGSLINRPHKGTGAGCTPFAMLWLKAAGVIPFVAEPAGARAVDDKTPGPIGARDFWQNLHRSAEIPWAHIGCDQRVGAAGPIAADYTVYDLLFYKERRSHLSRAIPGLAEKIREDEGIVTATLFAFGALTPLRDLVIAGKRKDPDELGDYGWAQPGDGFMAQFWDNARFSAWIKKLWQSGEAPPDIALVKEGRFLGLEIDAMATPRQTEPYFAEAERISAIVRQGPTGGSVVTSCEALFRLGLQ
jgi:hypothetical protein